MFIVDSLHHIKFGRIEHIVNVNVVGAEGALARLGRMRLAIDLAIVQIDLIRVVGFEIELAVASQTLEAGLVVHVAFDGPDAFERVHLVAAPQTLVLEAGVVLRRRDQRGRVADVARAHEIRADKVEALVAQCEVV